MFCFFKQKTAYELRISDWSSDVCSSDLTEPAVDLAQPLLAIEIVAVLAAVAVAGGPGDDLDHLGPLDGLELLQLGLQPRQPCRRDVVLCPGRDRRRSEERRVGKESFSTFRSRWSAYP